MRRTLAVGGVTALLCLTASPALALGAPQRPPGTVVTGFTSDNGGDNGWGNCGHNSSGGDARTGLGTVGTGNGGYKPWDLCPSPSPDDPSTTTTPASQSSTISFS
jgi:hypothetical protein